MSDAGRPKRDCTPSGQRAGAAAWRSSIYTDGACKGNPGPGGWGALLRAGDREKELFGGEARTTNNRMELTAVIRALRVAQAPTATSTLFTDSQYVKNGIETLDPRLEAQRLEDRGQEAGEERRAVARARERARAARRHAGTGCAATRDDAGNERADALANRGVARRRSASVP